MNNNSPQYIQIVQFSEFETVFNNLISSKKDFLAYFYGDYDNDGVSWCGDCNVSKPHIEEASKIISNRTEPVLYKFPIERTSWKDKSFLYRTHPKLKLTNVPTLLMFQKGSEFARLIEGQISDQEHVNDLFGLL
jgi:hypothetical protein